MKNTASRRTRKSARILAGSIAALLAVQSAHATSGTWLGTTDALWATSTNWSSDPNPVPGTGDTATFNSAGNGNRTIDLGAGVTISTILFDTASALGYTIGSGAVNSQTLTLDNGGAVTANSTVGYNQLFNSAITLGNDGTLQTFTLTNNSLNAALTFAGNITGSTGAGVKTLAVTGSGNNTVISGIIANGAGGGTVALTKSGTGRLTLSGNNTFTGGVTLSAGILRATTSTGALGLGTLTLSGGRLELVGGLAFARNTSVTADMLIVSDSSAIGAAATSTLGTLALGANTLSIGQGANTNSGSAGVTFSGTTTLSGAAVLNLGFNTTTTLAGITDAGNTLTLQGGGSFAQSAAWASGTAGGLTLSTTYRGTATLNQVNTFTGVVTIQSGFHTLVATSNAGALGLGTLDLQGGFLDLRNDTGLAFNRNTTVNGNSTIIAERATAGAGVTHTLGTLNMNGAFTLTVRGTNVTSGTAGLTFGATTLGGATTFDTFNPNTYNIATFGNVQLTLGAVTGGGFTLTKNSGGTLASAQTSGDIFGDGNIALNGGTLLIAPGSAGAFAVTGVNTAAGSTFTYRSGTVQLTKNTTSLDYTIGNAGAAADSVLVRSARGTMVVGATALANLGTGGGTERFMVNGQTTATNKNGAASAAGIYDASVVGQEGTGNTGVGSFLVADTVANGGFKQTAYTVAVTATTLAATTISDVTSSIAINTASNPYALRVGAFTLTNSGTTTVNGGVVGATNSGMGGVIMNPTATASTITGGTLAFGSSEGVVYVGSGAGGGLISSIITGSAGLTKFGPGTLTLSTATNSYLGGTVINGGTLVFATDAQIGAVPSSFDASNITINGGATMRFTAASGSSDFTLNANRGIVLGPGQQTISMSNGKLHYQGVISGTGGLNWAEGGNGGGSQFWLEAANTYTGDTVIIKKLTGD